MLSVKKLIVYMQLKNVNRKICIMNLFGLAQLQGFISEIHFRELLYPRKYFNDFQETLSTESKFNIDHMKELFPLIQRKILINSMCPLLITTIDIFEGNQ